MYPASYVFEYEDPDYQRQVDEDSFDDAAKTRMESLRRRYIVGMRKEGLHVEEERIGKHMFVKVSCLQERLLKEAENVRVELPLYGLDLSNPEEEQEAMIERRIKSFFRSLNAESHASAPFQVDSAELFKRKGKENDPILWSSLRSLLVYNILSNINISRFNEDGELPEKIGLSYLLMVRAFKEGFCLHDPSLLEPVSLAGESGVRADSAASEKIPLADPRRVLNTKWGRLCRTQPIHEIRRYFGEKIAFYFAWVSLLMSSLWLPAFLGLGVFVYGVTRRLEGAKKEGIMYWIDVLKSSSDNDLTPCFAAIICLWGTIFTEAWKRRQTSLAREWCVDNFDQTEPDRPQFQGTKEQINPFTKQVLYTYPLGRRMVKYFCSISVLLFMVMLVFISVTSVILYRVYMTVSFCGDGDQACDLLHGTILATLLNTLSIMMLGKVYEYIAVKLTEWENHQTLSEHNDALVIKLFAFQFANTYASLFYTAFFRRDFGGTGILGMDRRYTDNCGHADHDNCMSLLSFQLFVLMVAKPFPKFAKDVLWPWLQKILRRLRVNELDEDARTDEGVSKQHPLLREMLKPSAEDFRLSEFTEKMIQYGYLVLFAASFPLAPALALLFNVFDFRIDCRRLLWWTRRPTPYRDNDIGIWFQIINFINVCGVISNAFLIAFNSELGRNEPLYVKFAIVIGFEHFIFFIKFAIGLLIPDVPTWVKNSQKKERYLVSYLMKKLKSKETSKGHLYPSEECIRLRADENGDLELHATENGDVILTPQKTRWSY